MPSKLHSHCLAHAVLSNYRAWLGDPSPTALQVLLYGAEARAALTNSRIERWRIFGPLGQPEFRKPLVARTGDPRTNINGATALECIHYDMDDAMQELAGLVDDWLDSGRPVYSSVVTRLDEKYFGDRGDNTSFWHSLATRPGMWLGETTGWNVHCFLKGMDEGGDWLELPPLVGLRETVDGIASESRAAYGTEHATFRIENDCSDRLHQWFGLST